MSDAPSARGVFAREQLQLFITQPTLGSDHHENLVGRSKTASVFDRGVAVGIANDHEVARSRRYDLLKFRWRVDQRQKRIPGLSDGGNGLCREPLVGCTQMSGTLAKHRYDSRNTQFGELLNGHLKAIPMVKDAERHRDLRHRCRV